MPLVTPKRLRAVYAMLREMPPFDRWDLPPPGEVRFFVVTKPDQQAGYNRSAKGKHSIGINADMHASILHLIRSTSHELGHMRQDLLGRRPATKDEQHNREFRRLGRLICRDLGLDSENF